MKNKPKISNRLKKKMLEEFGHVPAKEELMAKLVASHERMIAALGEAWKLAPDDPNIRKDLADVVEIAAKLKGEIDNL